MELTVTERFRLMELLPHEGNFEFLRSIRKARQTLELTEQEQLDPEYGFNLQDDGRISFHETDATRDFMIGEVATNFIVSKLKELNGQDKLPDLLFSLYEKFIENAKE